MGEEGNRVERIIADIRQEDITSEKLHTIFETWSSTYDQVSEPHIKTTQHTLTLSPPNKMSSAKFLVCIHFQRSVP